MCPEARLVTESRMQAKVRMHILAFKICILRLGCSTRMQQKKKSRFCTSARWLITASHQHPRQSLSCTCPCISKGSNPHPTPILPPSQQHINAQSQQHVIFFIFAFCFRLQLGSENLALQFHLLSTMVYLWQHLLYSMDRGRVPLMMNFHSFMLSHCCRVR